MRPIVLLLAMLLATPAVGQTPSPGQGARMSAQQRAALARMLAQPRNHGMELRLARNVGIPAFLRRGAEPLAVAPTQEDEARAAIEFIDANAPLFLLDDPAQELTLEDVQADALGGHHYRYQQHVNGVPLRGAELLAHFNAGGEMYALTTQTVATPDIGTTPTLTLPDAAWIAGDLVNATGIEQQASLEIHRIDDAWRLVYAVHSMVGGINRWLTVIDAGDGAVLRHFLDHRDSSTGASGVDLAGNTRTFTAWKHNGLHYLVDATLPMRSAHEDPLSGPKARGDTHVVDVLNGDGNTQANISSNSANSGWDPAGVSAIANSQVAYRYFRDVHARDSFDDAKGSVLTAVHYGEDYDNAFWNGTWMVFGDGGRRFHNLVACVDVVAHEMTHGVIDHAANLAYENESGALNESFADVFGVLAANDGNWTVGEGCVKVAPGFMRSLSNPHASRGWQPAHYAEYVERPNTEDGDWGGVHKNSGIPNRAAYLLMEGLDAEGLGMSIGRERAARLYYHALTSYLLAHSEFIDLRRALLLAADYLHPGDAAVRGAVVAAFDAVGIVEGQDATQSGDGDRGITASALRLDFGDVNNGDSKSLALTLQNPTDRWIAVHEIVLDNSAFAHDFSNTHLAPGESLQGAVTFLGASTAGTQSAALQVVTDGDSPLVIDLVATVTAKPLAASSASGGGGAFNPLLLLLVLVATGRRRQR